MSRELDARVAVEVMGWERHGVFWMVPRVPDEDPRSYSGVRLEHFQPSTSIADAWLVVEKLLADGWHPTIEHDEETEQWYVSFGEAAVMFATAATAPEAICLAALAALAPGETHTIEEREL